MSSDRGASTGNQRRDSDSGKPQTSGILPQSMPSPSTESTQSHQPHRYDSNSPYEMAQSGYAQMPLPGSYDQGASMYSQEPSYMTPFTGLEPPGSKGQSSEDPSSTGILPSSSSTFASGAPGTAFSVLPPPLDASSQSMPIMPSNPGHSAYTSPVYGYGSTSPGYSGTAMGGSYQDMSQHPHPPHLYSSSMGSMSPQLNPYDGSSGGPSGMGHIGGPHSASAAAAAAQLSAVNYGGMGLPPMYGSGMGPPPYPYGHNYPEQFQRPGRGGYGGYGRGRGGGRGMSRDSGAPLSVNSPGPPIVNPGLSKGPDGANLFVFHIPNDFTNQEMYQMFAEHGNVLSVRIMVEGDTGRSRGFGFVSYDSAESAAAAIKHLNGFQVKGKRLKVQHKQIKGQGHGSSFEPPNSGFSYGLPQQQVHQEFSGPGDVPIPDNVVTTPMGHELSEPSGFHGPTSVLPPPPPEDEQEDASVLNIESQHQQNASRNTISSESPLENLSEVRSALPDP